MNSEASFFFPEQWALDAPDVWKWVKANALTVEHSLSRRGWQVWMPLGAGQ
jgi:hypothetical protein